MLLGSLVARPSRPLPELLLVPFHMSALAAHAIERAMAGRFCWISRLRIPLLPEFALAWVLPTPKRSTFRRALDWLRKGLTALVQTALTLVVTAVGTLALIVGSADIPSPEPEWETPALAGDALEIFVSKSDGDDLNPGTEAEPLETVAAGVDMLREGFPDHLRLKCGDVWDENIANGTASFVSGRSLSEPVYVGYYGSGAKPWLRHGEAWFQNNSYIFVDGIDFSANSYADGQTSPSWGGIAGGEEGLTYQDVLFGGSSGSQGTSDVTVRGCWFNHGWYDNGGTPTIILAWYAETATRLTIEWCHFDKLALLPGTTENDGARGIYLNWDLVDLVLRYNTFMRDGNEACVARSCGSIYGNVFMRSRRGLSIGYNHEPIIYATGFIRQNLFHLCTDASGASGTGLSFDQYTDGIDIEDNLFAHQRGNIVAAGIVMGGAVPDGTSNVVFDGNVLHEWVGTSATQTDSIGITVDGYDEGCEWKNGTIVASKGCLTDENGGIASVMAYGPGNRYYSPDPNCLRYGGAVEDIDEWIADSGDAGATFADPGFSDGDRDIKSFLESLGESPTDDEDAMDMLTDMARENRQGDFTPYTILFNNYMRAGHDMAAVS